MGGMEEGSSLFAHPGKDNEHTGRETTRSGGGEEGRKEGGASGLVSPSSQRTTWERARGQRAYMGYVSQAMQKCKKGLFHSSLQSLYQKKKAAPYGRVPLSDSGRPNMRGSLVEKPLFRPFRKRKRASLATIPARHVKRAPDLAGRDTIKNDIGP